MLSQRCDLFLCYKHIAKNNEKNNKNRWKRTARIGKNEKKIIVKNTDCLKDLLLAC